MGAFSFFDEDYTLDFIRKHGKIKMFVPFSNNGARDFCASEPVESLVKKGLIKKVDKLFLFSWFGGEEYIPVYPSKHPIRDERKLKLRKLRKSWRDVR